MKKATTSESLVTNMGLFEFRFLMPDKAQEISLQIIESLRSQKQSDNEHQTNLRISKNNY